MNRRKCRLMPEKIFFIIAGINVLIMLVLLLESHGAKIQLMTYGESLFCDFWLHINALLEYESIYLYSYALYPPFAYLLLLPFSKCVEFIEVPAGNSGFGILILIIFLFIFWTMFVLCVHKAYKPVSAIYQNVLPFIFLFSYPFWGCAFERGNPVIYAMIFLMIGLLLRNSNNKLAKQIGLLCVAISAAIKIYPALFGLLWLAEKRYKEAVTLVIYGVICFFLPFCFFDGFRGIENFVRNFIIYMEKDVYSQTSILGNCVLLFGKDTGVLVGKIIVFIWVLWVVYYVFSEGVTWRSLAMLTSTQTIVIAESYVYTYVFIAIPCIYFLNEVNRKKHASRMDYVYAILFAFVFTLPPLVNIPCGVLIGIYFSWIAILLLISAEKVRRIVFQSKS